MKRKLTGLLLAAALLAALCVPAMAATASNGVYDVIPEENYTLKILTPEDKSPVAWASTINGNVETVYEGVVKFSLTFDGQENDQYVVMLMSDDGTAPTQSNLRYIDQDSAADGSLSFTIYPDKLSTNGIHNLYLSSSTQEYTKIASFKVAALYEAQCLRGDADSNGEVDVKDATLIMNYMVKLETLTPLGEVAADCDGETGVDVKDALRIMNYNVKLADILE